MTAPVIETPKALLFQLFECAVAAAMPHPCLPPCLPGAPSGRTIVVGAGKAAASMAQALEGCWLGPLGGMVVTRYGHSVPTRLIEVVEAAHPVPDAAGLHAARRIMRLVQGLNPEDLVLCLISGGGSSLLTAPVTGLDFAIKQQINSALLSSGASIGEINCVRKHLSAIKGGRLALLCAPARVVTLLISDIPGDDPTVIASGPTLPDATTCLDALATLDKYHVNMPAPVRAMLETGASETPKPGDPRFQRNSFAVIANAQISLDAAAKRALASSVEVQVLSDRIEGEAREVAKEQAALARVLAQQRKKSTAPLLLLSGGETSVTVRGNGRGGRNTEYLLSLAIALDGQTGVYAIACDTDGIDGSEDNAGAYLAPDTLVRAKALGLDPADYLNNNDAYSFFEALGDLIVTGPTLTNVNDFRAILIQG
ncbi:glycerate kinase [soil metagenome]